MTVTPELIIAILVLGGFSYFLYTRIKKGKKHTPGTGTGGGGSSVDDGFGLDRLKRKLKEFLRKQ